MGKGDASGQGQPDKAGDRPVPRHLPVGQRDRGSRGRRRRRPLSAKDGYYLSQSQFMRQSLLKVCVSEKFFMVTMRWSEKFEQTNKQYIFAFRFFIELLN